MGSKAVKDYKQTILFSHPLPGSSQCYRLSTTYTKTKDCSLLVCMGFYCPYVMGGTRMLGPRWRCLKFQKPFRIKIPKLGHPTHVL